MIFSRADAGRTLRNKRGLIRMVHESSGLAARGRALFIIFSFLSFVPADAFSEDRFERIERELNTLEQKLETLRKENESLTERVKMINASEQEAKAMIDALRKASELLKESAKIEAGREGEEAQQPVSIGALKQEHEEIKERVEQIESNEEENAIKFANLVDVSGYADVEYYFTNQPGQNSKFRVRHFSLFFSKQIQDEWSLFSEIEFEDAPFIESAHTTDTASNVQGKFLVEQMYIKYQPTVDWSLVAGRFLTPAGIWNVYHYYPYVPTQERPFMVRNIFPQWSDGLQLRKSFNVFDSLLDMHLYVANGAGNPGRLDRNVSKALGAKLNYIPDLIVDTQLGASYYREKDNQNITRSSYGLHLMLDYAQLGFQSEFARRQNNPLNAASYNDTSAYAQLTYDIDKWILAARYDWYDTNSLLSLADKYRYTGAINYRFAHNVLGKLEYNLNTFDDPASQNFHEVIMAITVAIGDL